MDDFCLDSAPPLYIYRPVRFAIIRSSIGKCLFSTLSAFSVFSLLRVKGFCRGGRLLKFSRM